MFGGRTRRWLWLTVATGTLMAICAVPAGAVTTPKARQFSGLAPIGALFTRDPHGRLGKHFCSASVVNSRGGDLVITAAHCMDGRAPSQVAFVPGFAARREPYGVWLVKRVIRDEKWLSSADPDNDIAFLLVARPGSSRPVESLTGGEGLSAPEPGERVLTVGYPDNDSRPVACVNVIQAFGNRQVEFDCHGYPDGTSGGPLLTDVNPVTGLGVIVGVIGGYEQGGYTDAVSYASRFGGQVASLYGQASATPVLETAIRRHSQAKTPSMTHRPG